MSMYSEYDPNHRHHHYGGDVDYINDYNNETPIQHTNNDIGDIGDIGDIDYQHYPTTTATTQNHHRSCFRAFINPGGGGKSTKTRSRSNKYERKPDKANTATTGGSVEGGFPQFVEDSFFTTTTTATNRDDGGGGGGSASCITASTATNYNYNTGRKKKNGTSVLCLRNNMDRRYSYSDKNYNNSNHNSHHGGTGGADNNSVFDRTSHAGLLDEDSTYEYGYGGGIDALTWKTTKTTATNSSAASSSRSHRSRMSSTRKISGRGGTGTGAGAGVEGIFPSGAGYDSFDLTDIDEEQLQYHHHHHHQQQPIRTLGKTFIGCVGLKKPKPWKGGEGFGGGGSGGGNGSQSMNRRRKEDDDHIFINQREIMVEEPILPSASARSGSPEVFKFHNALPMHTGQNLDFPQIIFAEQQTNDNHYGNNNVGAAAGGGENERTNHHDYFNDGFHHTHTTAAPALGQEFQSSPFHSNNYNTRRRTVTRSPSPVRRQSSSSSRLFSGASPTTSRSRSRASRNNASPKSIRSRQEEEIFLDQLVNTVAQYNNYQQERRAPSGGRAILNQLMEQNERPLIPDCVEIDHYEEYSDDEVSDVGMASTSGGSGGEKNGSFDEDSTPKTLDFHNHQQQQQEQQQENKRHAHTNDYFDPSIKQVKKPIYYSTNNEDDVVSKLMNVDERSLKWRMREAEKEKNSNIILNTNSKPAHCPSRELMETGKCLMDHDCSGSSAEYFASTASAGVTQGYSNLNPNNNDGEDADPTYAFGGSGVRKPPLGISEAFEDFGIDDRIFAKEHRPGDTFVADDCNDEEGDENFVPSPSSSSVLKQNTRGSNSIRSLSRLNDDKKEFTTTRRASLMNKYIQNHHENLKSDNIALTKTQSIPRSSKYKSMNGTAIFSRYESSLSSQTSKRSNGHWRQSPQSIAIAGYENQ